MKRTLAKRLLRPFGSIFGNQRGNVLVIAAMGMPAMIGAAGLGTDTVQWYLWKRQIQQAADSAALVGAHAIANGQSLTAAKTAAETYLAGIAPLDGVVPVVTSYTDGDWPNGAVKIDISYAKGLPFSSMFLNAAPTIRSSATAAVDDVTGPNCIVALGTSKSGIVATGGTVTMDCGAATNSKDADAAVIDESFDVPSVTAVGGIDGTPADGTALKPFSLAQPDPLAGLPAVPTMAGCSGEISSSVASPSGCYSGIKVNGNDDVVLGPGTYYIDGDVDLTGNGSLIGYGVTLILSSDSKFKSTGNQKVVLTAPSSGTYKGVIIYQDRGAATVSDDYVTETETSEVYVDEEVEVEVEVTDKKGNKSKVKEKQIKKVKKTVEEQVTKDINKFGGTSGSTLAGAIYMKKQKVKFHGNAGVDASCLRVVSESFSVKGNVTISSSCPNEPNGSFNPRIVRLVA